MTRVRRVHGETPLTTEFASLAGAIGLGLLHILLASHSASLQRGYLWAASARDEIQPPLTGIAGRLERASRNFFETFPLFLGAVLLVVALGRHDDLTAWGALLYLGGRAAYLPMYALGIPLVRSLVWNVATVGIVLILVGAFRGFF